MIFGSPRISRVHPLASAVVAAAAAAALGGLALASTAAGAADWRHAVVQSVVPRSATDPAMDLDCAPATADSSDPRVVVVAYRVGKASYVRAIVIAPDDDFAPHEKVLVDPGACRVAHVAKAAQAQP